MQHPVVRRMHSSNSDTAMSTLFQSIQYSLLPEDVQSLLKEVEGLRRIAERIVCNCGESECPFKLQPGVFGISRTHSLPAEAIVDCEYVSDEEDVYGPLQTCRFMRTQPGRRGSAPGNRNQPRLALRTLKKRAGSVSNAFSISDPAIIVARRHGSLSTVVCPSCLNTAEPLSN